PRVRLLACMAFEVLADPGAQLGEVGGAVVLCELVVERGLHALVYLLDRGAPLHGLARELLLRVVRLIAVAAALLLADLGADQHVVDSVRKPAGRDLKELILALYARKRLVVDEPLDGCEHPVAVRRLGASLDLLQGRLALAKRVERLVDLLVGDLDLGFRDLESLVVLDRDFRLEIESRTELERLAQVGFLGDDLGSDHGLEAVLLESLLRVLADELLDHFAADLVAEESFQEAAG